jgi:DNA-binding MarR family transcriptional regulator
MVSVDILSRVATSLASKDLETGGTMAHENETQRDDEVSDEDWAIRLGFYIHDTSRLRRIIYNAALKPAGVTRSQAWVLAYLGRKDGMAQSDLAGQLDLGKVALGGLVDRLEAAELVERRADAKDRRVKRIFLTAAGRKVVNKMRSISGPTNAEILAGISPEDVRATARTLRLIKDNLLRMAGGKLADAE